MDLLSNSDDFTAPLEFHVTNLDETRISVATDDCPMCNKARKVFFCKNCVRNGDFYSFYCNERFADKHLCLLRLKNERKELEMLCEAKLEWKLKKIQLASDIQLSKDRIKAMREFIFTIKNNIKRRKVRLLEMQEINNKTKEKLPKYKTRVEEMAKLTKDKCLIVSKERKKILDSHNEFKNKVRKHITYLVHDIFNIYTIKPSESRDIFFSDNLEGSGFEEEIFRRQVRHCIITPILLGSGDYSSYNTWVAANKDGIVSPGVGRSVKENEAYKISAGLAYTTQLVNIIAWYLDVKLPYKLYCGEFYGPELSESKFTRRVARLNWNILHLCFSQNVDPKILNPNHTLQNLLFLLNTNISDLGRFGPTEVDPVLARNLEDDLLFCINESYDDSCSDDENDLPNDNLGDALSDDWEVTASPLFCPEEGSGPSRNYSFISSQSTSITGGLVSSATASIMSMFRGLTGNR